MSTPPIVSKQLSMPPPRPLQLSKSNTAHSRASSSVSSAPDSPSSTPSSFTWKPLARRQGSIAYLPSDSNPRYDIRAPISTSHLRRNNSVDSRAAAPSTTRGERRTGPIAEPERSPLTLADKHADLLSFIAQKESKCLELRSQLAAHEAELTQLKRKWERIVNKGFDRVAGVNGSGPSTPQVLDGIKEGVQGVGRLLAAGLGEFTVPPITPPAVTELTRTHSTQQSTSSVTTSSSVSARLSQSSINSSAAEDDFPLESPEEQEEQGGQVLIVGEIEPAPTVNSSSMDISNVVDISNVEQDKDKVAKMLRRRSRDVLPSAEGRSASTLEKNRARLSKMTMAPVSSIPGLGSLPPGTPSWVMGTVGKKWEEIQQTETFAKNQKRASILLSDMSQSLMNAWSSPTASPASASGSTNSLVASVSPTSPMSGRSANASSLLDGDGDVHRGLGAVMKPDSTPGSQYSKVSKTPTPLASPATHMRDDDDDWNW